MTQFANLSFALPDSTRVRVDRLSGSKNHILPAMRRRPWRNRRQYRVVSLFGVLAVSTVLMSWPSVHQAHEPGPVDIKAAAVPTPAHVVVVVEENRSQTNIIGNKSAPYINQLAANGAMMAQSFAEVHPSEPNYYALFAGNTLVNDNVCPFNAGNTPNLGSQLLAAGYTFVGYAESLPALGSTECRAGKYARKHVPWVSFSNIPGLLLASVFRVSRPVELRQPADRRVRHPEPRQ